MSNGYNVITKEAGKHFPRSMCMIACTLTLTQSNNNKQHTIPNKQLKFLPASSPFVFS